MARASPGVAHALALLGRRIRAIRRENGLTQEEAAHRAGLDAKHLQAAEAGRANLTVASLVGIARGLNVKLSSLFDGD